MSSTVKVIDDGIVANSRSPDNGCELVAEDSCAAIQIQMSRNGQSRPGKRPIKNVSPSEKVDAIDRVHEGESKASVARDIGVPESTLRGWCKSEQKIRSQCNNASAEMMAQHSPVNIGSGRPMSTNGRQSAGSRPSSNGRQSTGTLSEEEAPCLKRPKLERNGRQNSPQTVIPGPSNSKSLLGCFEDFNREQDRLNPAIRAESYATLMATMKEQQQLAQLQQMSFLAPIAKNLLNMNMTALPRGGVGLVENGLQYTRSGSNTFPTMVTTMANSIGGIDNTVRTNLMTNLGNAIDHNIANRHIAVAPQMTSKPYTKKSPSVSPAAEAPSTPVPASPNENNAQQKNNSVHGLLNEEALWLWMSQQYQEVQRLQGITQLSTEIPFDLRKSWFWQYWKYCHFQLQEQSTNEEFQAGQDYLANNGENNSNESESYAHNASALKTDNAANDRLENAVASTSDRATTTAYAGPSTATTSASTMTTNSEAQEEAAATSCNPLDLTKVLKSAKKHPRNVGIEEAIEHGTKFLEWLNNCSIPLLSVLQVLRVKYTVDVLKWVRDAKAQQNAMIPDTCRMPTGRNTKDRL